MILEFCSENFTKVPAAIAKGANRIELCDNLAAGGTTPSHAVIEHTVNYANSHEATVMTMIRPRGGNFIYSADEFNIMKKDLKIAKKLNSHGVVFGCLDEEKRIHRPQIQELIALSDEMETVFHMAFDEISHDQAREELDWLVEQGITRILTHGGRDGTIFENIEWLKELIKYANNRIEILVGGGVTYENYQALAKVLPTNQFHGTRIVDFKE